MEKAVTGLETRRLALQEELDARRDAAVRNRMGQFATPTSLAVDIQRYAKARLGKNERLRFIDPAIGTGAFYSALLHEFSQARIDAAIGYEIDPHYGRPAAKLWGKTGLEIILEDFTWSAAPEASDRFNLLICNPPYVRHHHIDSGEKQRLRSRAQASSGVRINGLAGLYCYFLCISHMWLTAGGLAGWLIPSEFMDVKYGIGVKRYLLEKVTLHHIHRFDPNNAQFCDALVSSAVVWFRNEPPRPQHQVRFTYGGTLEQPVLDRLVPLETLRREPKWTRFPKNQTHEAADGPVLGDFFKIKRGLATGNNSYFILSAEQIRRRQLPMDAFKPILPSPRYVPEDEVEGDRMGNPLLKLRLFLLDPPWTESEIKKRYPNLWAYLEEGKAEGVTDRYICRHRALWYRQEFRPPAPFVCTYMGRSDRKSGRPFRFILNNSKATAANVYLMLYPKEPVNRVIQKKPLLKRQVWEFLNEISPQVMLGEGRVYGGGLYKLEPKELANVPADAIAELFPESARPRRAKQAHLFDETTPHRT